MLRKKKSLSWFAGLSWSPSLFILVFLASFRRGLRNCQLAVLGDHLNPVKTSNPV